VGKGLCINSTDELSDRVAARVQNSLNTFVVGTAFSLHIPPTGREGITPVHRIGSTSAAQKYGVTAE